MDKIRRILATEKLSHFERQTANEFIDAMRYSDKERIETLRLNYRCHLNRLRSAGHNTPYNVNLESVLEKIY